MGLADERELVYAFKHANIVIEPGNILKDATLLIQKGKVIGVGNAIAIPSYAVVYDLQGQYIYPSFVDAYTDYDQADTKIATPVNRRDRRPQAESATAGATSWNQAIHPEFDAFVAFVANAKEAQEFRKLGFGIGLSLQKDGIARGTGAVVLMGDGDIHKLIIKDKAANAFSFSKGTSTQDYPSSLMGSIALLRQTYLDAQWYKNAKEKDFDLSLAAWNDNLNLLQVFEVNDYRSALRANIIAKEFGQQYTIRGGGDEYKRIDEIANCKSTFIVPLNFPKAYDISNPFDALNINLDDMRHWEMAPANAGVLEKSKVNFVLTTDGLKDKKEFSSALQKAVKCGLSKEQALKALTTIPAKLLGVENQVGSLKNGMLANFFICTKDYFERENVIVEHWISGERYIIKNSDSIEVRNKYKLSLDTLHGWNLSASGDAFTPEWTLHHDTIKVKVEASSFNSQWTFRFETKKGIGAYRLNGSFNANGTRISGQAQNPDGKWMTWSAEKMGPTEAKKDTTKKDSAYVMPQIWLPNMAYGWKSKSEIPSAGSVWIKNVTVWTCEDQGILQNAEVILKDGKIIAVGKISDADKNKYNGSEIIDGTGMHLTPGIIDEHSHIAINEGVNEGTQSITSEVRIGDVINPEDINIYRQLAGGVTTSHLLHGSANAIGGQTILIKLRWGRTAEEMKFKGADGFIKFALGENVKQSNWGDNNVTRYPQTRMGVEQIYIDAFTRAKEYDNSWKKFNLSKSKGIAPRRDLELEALAEILYKKRFITCHSYQQGEINMLMHVADSFQFRVNTFTHILEGYKVADKMKAHGVGASTFSDWWAYKYEVIDAIPYNGAIMHNIGLVTGFNSDDAEMARRLNQEAAKACKYGNISEEEALKFVTLNPAKLLHVSDQVGSIKIGKDADIVLWSGPPLSVYSKPVKTFVDGICYFDLNRDEQLRNDIQLERQRIIKKMQDEKAAGGPIQKGGSTPHEEYHCNDMENAPH
ncbi:MAG: amidohydrolase family protein [Bacteroidetes bacterium]|nr:amidohydrolase family protein [Bacteroidota bacterium]